MRSLLLLFFLPAMLAAYQPPQLSNIQAAQRRDGSKIMDVTYSLASDGTRVCEVKLFYSTDGGATFSQATGVSGDVGQGVQPGASKKIAWQMTGNLASSTVKVSLRVTADDGLVNLTKVSAPVMRDPGASVNSMQGYTVSWSKVSGAASYTVEKAVNNSFTGAVEFTLPDTAKSYSDTVSSTTTYYFRVRANNEAGGGGWSNTVDMVVNSSPEPSVDTAIVMVSIPGGTFQMGSTTGYGDEQPVHQVTLSSFQMSKYEITNAQYAVYLNAAKAAGEITATTSSVTGAKGDYSGQEYILLSGSVNSNNKCWISYNGTSFSVVSGRENWPVVYVTWYGSKAFALYYGLDLPTEAQWEYAARGGKQNEYGTDDGTISSAKANYDYNIGYPKNVGSYPANPFGLYDLAGNVFEWCSDWYGSYSSAGQTDPTGPSSGSPRVLRGGSWSNYAYYCRAAYRDYDYPGDRSSYIGFRVVRGGALLQNFSN